MHHIGVFFDLSKTYNTTRRCRIIEQFHQGGYHAHLPVFLQSLLSKCFFRYRDGGVLSDRFEQENGVPHGSFLSVPLFATAINTVHSKESCTVLLIHEQFGGFLFLLKYCFCDSSTATDSAEAK